MLRDRSEGQQKADPERPEAKTARASWADRRNAVRVPVIKSAKIDVGPGVLQATFDCLVLDESMHGVLVDLGTMVKLPEAVTVRLQGGGTYSARLRWARGTKAGLEFTSGQVMTAETALRMMKIADVLQTQGVIAAVSTLRAARFFDHVQLQRVAEEAEVVYRRLEALLTGHVPL